jgi:hypothetical protein
MNDLTEIAISALIASPVMMAIAAVAPDYAWVIGVVLMLWGILSDVRAYLEKHDLKGYVIGTVTLAFGIATELASVEQLVYLVILAVIWGAFWALIKDIVKGLGLKM